MKEKKSEIKLLRRPRLVGALAVAAMGVILIAAFLMLRGSTRTRVSDAFYVNRGEVTSTDGARWTVVWDETDGAYIKGSDTSLRGLLLYTKEGSVILTDRYVLQYANGDTVYRMEAFSTVTQTEEGIVLQDGSDTITVEDGVLFDGTDTYLFLTEVTLTVDGEEQVLPPLSSIRVVKNDIVDFYRPDTGAECILIYEDTEVTVALSGGRTLDPETDRVLLFNGAWTMMMPDAEGFDRISAWKE